MILQQELFEASSHLIDKDEVHKMEVRLAKPEEMATIHRLTYEQYLKENYCKENESGEICLYPYLDELDETTVLVVEKDGVIIGTNTITVDNYKGMPCDCDFPGEMYAMRTSKYTWLEKLGCCWRLITKEEYRGSKEVICLLFSKSIEVMLANDIDICVFVVNPKHADFYTKLFGIKKLCESTCDAVGQPGVLMIGYIETIVQKWMKVSKRWGIPFND